MFFKPQHYEVSHDFLKTFYQDHDVVRLLEWLCTTPKTTCIRVNVLRNSPTDIRSSLLEAFVKHHPSIECPNISSVNGFPEVMLVDSLNDSKNLERIPNGKEVIVDVNCGASILRGNRDFIYFFFIRNLENLLECRRTSLCSGSACNGNEYKSE